MNRSRARKRGAKEQPSSESLPVAEPTVAEVCEKYAAASAKIAIDDIDGALVLLRGSSTALLFLSELLRAHALSGDTGFHLSPKGVGAVLFSDPSKYGLYILRTEEPRRESSAAAPPASAIRPRR